MQALDITQPFMINEDVVYTQVENEIVMMDPKDGGYHGLNLVGAELWALLEEKPMALKDMVTYLKETYTLEEDVAMTDVSVFLDEMLKQDFLILSDN
ncbi:MAG: PqqD family protein [Gammaproteobacteria bacterium]|nr:PqqD family protein [Gammaproteobacteria bacterium]